MGTRHLIAIFSDGQYRLAQYGQWDGYPSGQGLDILTWLNEQYSLPLRNIAACRFLTDEEIENADFMLSPHLRRDVGSDILDMIRHGPVATVNSIEFAADGLFCEWAYVIDIDAGVFEVYEGFRKKGEEIFGRFKDLEGDGKYAPVSLVKSYSLTGLPTRETFLADLDPADEEAA